jgi:hypothetical protein
MRCAPCQRSQMADDTQGGVNFEPRTDPAAAIPTWPHDVHSILTIIGVLPSIPAGTKKPPVSLHRGLKVA